MSHEFVFWLAVCSGVVPYLALAGSQRNPGQAIRVSSGDLVDAYLSNIALADKQYTKKVIEVEGKICGVYKSTIFREDREYGYVLQLYPGKKFVTGRIDSWVYIHCMFTKAAKNQLAELKPNQTVVISGRCVGWELPEGKAVRDATRIPIYNCRVVTAPATR